MYVSVAVFGLEEACDPDADEEHDDVILDAGRTAAGNNGLLDESLKTSDGVSCSNSDCL